MTDNEHVRGERFTHVAFALGALMTLLGLCFDWISGSTGFDFVLHLEDSIDSFGYTAVIPFLMMCIIILGAICNVVTMTSSRFDDMAFRINAVLGTVATFAAIMFILYYSDTNWIPAGIIISVFGAIVMMASGIIPLLREYIY